MSQSDEIIDYLKSGQSLTSLDALYKFRVMRLAARIEQLRKQGYQIETEIVKSDGKKWAKYYIPKPKQIEMFAA